MKAAIIGGGAAGLAAGYFLSKSGWRVSLFEKDSSLGGLAGSFLLDGAYVEKFYHFICLNDHTYLQVLQELNQIHRLKWRYTEMGQYYNGELYSFGRPFDLLTFPHLTLRDKFRFGTSIMRIKSSPWEDWKKIENIPVEEWLVQTFGREVFHALHEPMIRLKFGAFTNQLSASWMWARIHRLGKSRTRIRQREKVGYVDGGSQIVMDALGDAIRSHDGSIHLNASVSGFLLEGGAVKGIIANGQDQRFDVVISTVPLPAFLRLIPESLEGDYWSRLRRIKSIGVVCVFLRTRKSLTRFFWTNISDPLIQLAGVIEFTNLNPFPHLGGDKIIYLPQYLPSTAEKFSRPDEELIREYLGYLKKINPDFREADVKTAMVFREKYAQPICEVGFSRDMPAFQTSLRGLYLTDSSQLHPDDRTISNSLGLGKSVAAAILADHP